MSIEKVHEIEKEVLGSVSKCAECDNSSSFVVFIWDSSTLCTEKYLCQDHFAIFKKKLPNPSPHHEALTRALNHEIGFRKL